MLITKVYGPTGNIEIAPLHASKGTRLHLLVGINVTDIYGVKSGWLELSAGQARAAAKLLLDVAQHAEEAALTRSKA